MELVPRMRTLMLPPGAPEFWVTWIPEARACIPWATLTTGVCIRSEALMETMDPVVLDLRWVP